jgi:hypothetical protein
MSEYEKEVFESIQRKLARLEARFDKVFQFLTILYKQEKAIMAKIDDLLSGLADESKAIDDLAIAVTAGTVDQTKVDAAIALVKTNHDKLAAISASLPAAPSPPPPPPVDVPPAA